MSDETPDAENTPAAEAAATPNKWYRVLCWPTADRSGKPLVYVTPQATAAEAIGHARGKINARNGDEDAEKWTFTVQRTTKPKDASDGGGNG